MDALALWGIGFLIVVGLYVGLVLYALLRPRFRPPHSRAVLSAPKGVRTRRLLSDSEAAFYWTLLKATEGRWVVLPKVPLSYFLRRLEYLPRAFYTMLENGHVDFLLVHPRSWEPAIAIELDDSSHQTPGRQERDRRKEVLLRAAGLPLLRWKVGEQWDVEEIARRLRTLS